MSPDNILRRVRVSGGTVNAEPVAINVGGLQVALGVDDNNNGQVEDGEWVTTPSGAGEITNRNVLKMRVTVLGRTTTTVPDPALDGTIELTVEARNADDADVDGVLVEGDGIQWRFTVTNTSDEELWGTYVYLELHGPAWCEDTNLEPGASTDC